ncbi:hypothetical protein [Formosa agariphila]|uniref:hypothetical protein n=1 Tax=Formosa agariphila TaxID=320324 RepID=UPI0005713C2D|nr:hypothetical protein [Formosa agariphila]
MKNHHNNPNKRQGQDTKNVDAIQLFNILYKKPISRRMSATLLGYTDQTYMVTQIIFDWIQNGHAQVVGQIKCKRSNRFVEAITTNPDYFIVDNNNQLSLF